MASCPSATDTSQVDLVLQTNWMRCTGWAEMFDGARRDLLVEMSRLPDDEGNLLTSLLEDKTQLRYIVLVVDGLLDRCEDTVRHTDVSMRCWLCSLEPYRLYKAPFKLVCRLSSTQKYRGLIKRLLCFCF
ncbi:hypothetical protein LZ30DRAFT_609813 [Colletotrichum cereale]|nr:hypothetical protein LZ30DRAFT_609813 [Colletotrichum cereale]